MTNLESLPVLPGPHARALSLLQQSDVDISDVADVVEADPALTTSVLRAANSAASAPANEVNNAARAIMRIGFDATRRIVTAAVVGSSFGDIQRAGLDVDQLWQHLIACAIAADRAMPSDSAHASGFSAGLLHDLGRMAMAQSEPERYAEVVALTKQGADPREAESRVFGYDHQEFGAGVAEQWKLPADITEAVGDHHGNASGAVARAVRSSRRLVLALGYGDGLRDAPSGDRPLGREETRLLSSIGGAAALRNRVEWWQHTVHGAAA